MDMIKGEESNIIKGKERKGKETGWMKRKEE
jgi:hypothetical protein